MSTVDLLQIPSLELQVEKTPFVTICRTLTAPRVTLNVTASFRVQSCDIWMPSVAYGRGLVTPPLSGLSTAAALTIAAALTAGKNTGCTTRQTSETGSWHVAKKLHTSAGYLFVQHSIPSRRLLLQYWTYRNAQSLSANAANPPRSFAAR